MKARDVVIQLWNKLPFKTQYFNTVNNITSLTYSGGIVTAITVNPLPSNFNTGDIVVITGALTPNPITSLTRIDNVAYATTATPHDLTFESPPNDTSYNVVTIQGATQSAYNGVNKKLLSVPNRQNFTYEVLGNPITPATGAPLLLEDKAFGYNGVYPVTVTGTNSFTYALPYAVGSPAQGSPQANYDLRITSAVSFDRATAMYSSKQTNEFWAFVVLNDVAISKDRHIESDATETYNSGCDYMQSEINAFTVYVYAPASYSLSGSNIRDIMEDVRVFLYSSLLGHKFSTGLSQDAEQNTLFETVATGHGQALWNGAYYIHEFKFESRSDIHYADTVGPDINVAWRDIDLSFYKNEDPAQIIMHTPIDLDEVTL